MLPEFVDLEPIKFACLSRDWLSLPKFADLQPIKFAFLSCDWLLLPKFAVTPNEETGKQIYEEFALLAPARLAVSS